MYLWKFDIITINLYKEKNYGKRCISFYLMAGIMMLMSISVFAGYPAPDSYYEEASLSEDRRYEAVPETVYVVDIGYWKKYDTVSGKGRVCYFIDKPVKLNYEVTIREGSMLIIKKGGKLTIGKGGRLHVKGFLGVHSGGVLNPLNCDVFIYKTGVVNVNGKLGVSKNASINVEGELRLTDNSTLINKGKMNIAETGIMTSSGKVDIQSGSVVEGEIQTVPKGKAPFYLMPEIDEKKVYGLDMESSALGGFDSGYYITDRDEITYFARSAETVIRRKQERKYPIREPIPGDGGDGDLYFVNYDKERIYFAHSEMDTYYNGSYYLSFYGMLDYGKIQKMIIERYEEVN